MEKYGDAIFEGTYRHRNLFAMTFAGLFLAVGSFFLYFFVYVLLIRAGQNPAWLGGHAIQPVSTYIILMIISPTVAYGTLLGGHSMARAAVRNSVSQILIDGAGVRVGRNLYRWHSIHWFGARRSLLNPFRLEIIIEGKGGGHVAVPTSETIDREKFEQLCSRIETLVGPRHPDLLIGGISLWISRPITQPAPPA